MPDDRPHPKQSISEAIRRGLSDPKADPVRQKVRMGEHPQESERDVLAEQKRQREIERVERLVDARTRRGRRSTRS